MCNVVYPGIKFRRIDFKDRDYLKFKIPWIYEEGSHWHSDGGSP